MSSPVFCAIDTVDVAKAEKLAAQVKGHVHGLKLGLEFFLANGVGGYQSLAKSGVPIFLDVKLHD
ncbi:MAG: orotidine 5'-phosphate decarboxylase / HUMPS family protein, partial [Alphaproteobacteria bacterium]